MANIVDYIKWRGDIPFSASALNEVDAALFCLISYWDMDGVVSDKLDETITLKELCNSDILVKLPYYCSEEDRTIKELLKYSERFSEVKISKYINNVDTERQIQFSAVTFSFDKKSTFVAYRGTDDSLVGWKECMDLAYSEEVEGQKEAVNYLADVVKKTKGSIYIGGHSKGGNLAVFAGAFSSGKVNNRIQAVYNFDGPGFNSEVIQKENFKTIEYRIHTFVPQDSLVGMLLAHKEPYQVVLSKGSNGFSQHYLAAWEVEGKKFMYRDKLTFGGESASDAIKDWIDGMSFEEKRQFIEVLYGLVDEYKTVGKLFTVKSMYKVMMEYRNIDSDKKRVVYDAIGVLKKSMFNEVKETIGEVKKKTIDKITIFN